MPKIIAIESGLPMDGSYYKVGWPAKENKKVVTEIKDMSMKFESGVLVRYDIYTDGKLFSSWINAPARIFYETEDGPQKKINRRY